MLRLLKATLFDPKGGRLSSEHPGRRVDAGFQVGDPFTLAVARDSKSVNLEAAGFDFSDSAFKNRVLASTAFKTA
jgi:hypothetical protein